LTIRGRVIGLILPLSFFPFKNINAIVHSLIFNFLHEDGGVTIIDWKTGRKMSEDVSMQLSCYAMYAMDNFPAMLCMP